MKKSTQTANAFVRGANLDTSMMYMGSIMSFLVRAQDTDGRFAMVEYRARPGNEPPPHVHLWEHEIFSVLEGKIEFHCEDQVRDGRSRRNDLSSEREGTCILYPIRISPNADHLPGNYRRAGRLGQLLREHGQARDQHGHPDRCRHLSHGRPVTCDRDGQEIRYKNVVTGRGETGSAAFRRARRKPHLSATMKSSNNSRHRWRRKSP